jgi:hypothetical protein
MVVDFPQSVGDTPTDLVPGVEELVRSVAYLVLDVGA